MPPKIDLLKASRSVIYSEVYIRLILQKMRKKKSVHRT
jgi:hypothetical protein